MAITEETNVMLEERVKAPKRKALRKAAKAAAKLEKKQEKARKKAWKKARPKKEPWVSPILWVNDVRAHAQWCERAFGFEICDVMDGPDGTAQHAMLKHRRGTIMLGKARDAAHGAPSGKATATIYIYVASVDDLALRAQAAGAKLLNPPRDEFWGDRCVPVIDAEGHSWMFATHLGQSADCASDQGPECNGGNGGGDDWHASA
ncbi:MAG: VOC family protein [Planctomycetota bacterium]